MNYELAAAHWDAVKRGELPMFTIYDSPADYPGKFVVRMWLTKSGPTPTDIGVVADTLKDAREAIPPGLHRLPRQEQDEPQIVETWF